MKAPVFRPDPHDWEELSHHNGNGHLRLRCKKCKAIGFRNVKTGVIKTFAEHCEKRK